MTQPLQKQTIMMVLMGACTAAILLLFFANASSWIGTKESGTTLVFCSSNVDKTEQVSSRKKWTRLRLVRSHPTRQMMLLARAPLTQESLGREKRPTLTRRASYHTIHFCSSVRDLTQKRQEVK
jgi:hypothetical protein